MMSASVLYMPMSFDGFIAGPQDGIGNGLGNGGHRPSVLDELEIHQIPVLLGRGRRLFDGLGPQHVELALTRVVDGPGVTHLRYRVDRSAPAGAGRTL